MEPGKWMGRSESRVNLMRCKFEVSSGSWRGSWGLDWSWLRIGTDGGHLWVR